MSLWLKVMDKATARQSILSFRTPSSRGLELALENYEIIVRIPGVKINSSKVRNVINTRFR